MYNKKIFMKILSAALLFFSLTAFAGQNLTVKVYTVHFADPSEITAIAPLMMSSTNGLVIKSTDRRIIVKGTPEQHEMVRSMIHDLDTPPKNIQVRVQFDRTGTRIDRSGSIRPDGPVVIEDHHVSGSFEGRLKNRRTTVDENMTQILVAMDGKQASLRVGETVPYLKWLTRYGCRYGYIQQAGIKWRDVGAFLAVEPEIAGTGLIRVKVIPELSGHLENGEKHQIQFTHLATEVTVRNGQSVQIGGFDKDKDFSSKFLIGRSGGGESSITRITLTPQILSY